MSVKIGVRGGGTLVGADSRAEWLIIIPHFYNFVKPMDNLDRNCLIGSAELDQNYPNCQILKLPLDNFIIYAII